MGGSKLRKTVRQKWAFTRDISINMSFHPQRKSHKKFELRTNHTWTNNAVKNTNWPASSKHLVSQVFNFHQNILCLLEKVCVEKNEDAQVELSTVSRAGFPGLHPHCTSWCVQKAPGETEHWAGASLRSLSFPRRKEDFKSSSEEWVLSLSNSRPKYS